MSQQSTEGNDDSRKQTSDAPKRLSDWLSRTFPGHETTAVCGFVGFVLAILVLVIGFWQSLVIALFVVAGIAVGQLLEGNPKIIRAVQRWLSDRRQ